MTSFPTPGPVTARIDVEMGDIRVAAGPVRETVVDVVPTDPSSDKDRRAAEATRVSCADGRLEVVGPRRGALAVTRRPGSVQVTIEVPAGSAVDARTGLGLIATEGDLGEVVAKTGAGDIRVHAATSAELRTGLGAVTAGRIAGEALCSTGSGRVHIDRVDGRAEVRNSNGDTRIGDSGSSLRVKAANGAVTVERARGDLVATSANGALRVGSAERGSVQLRTSLGSIDVGIRTGTAARLDLRTGFGSVRNQLDAVDAPGRDEETVEIHAGTSAGDITVTRVLVEDE